MKVLAIVRPSSLVAKELRDQLARHPQLWREVRLLSSAEDEIGILTEVGGAAAVVRRLDADALDGVDLAFLCGSAEESRQVLAMAPAAMRAVVLSFDAGSEVGVPLVAGVNLPAHVEERLARSPHPGAILLAHLLHPLQAHGLRRAEATLLQPVSVFTPEALEQLFEQARSLLTFQKVAEATHWTRQLAFNLHGTEGGGDVVRRQTEAILAGAGAPEVSAQLVQSGVFHGFAASVHLAFDGDPGAETLREALGDNPAARWADEEPLGPVDAAAVEEVLLGHLRADAERPGSYWLWAVMDNLTRGGANNAIAIAAAMLS